MLSLQTPFPIQSADLLWSWLQESPDSNLTLRTLERVARAMDLQLDIRLTRAHEAAA